VPNLALFDIDADGLDQGVDVVNGATITLTLRQSPPIGIRSVVYQVFDAAAFDPGPILAWLKALIETLGGDASDLKDLIARVNEAAATQAATNMGQQGTAQGTDGGASSGESGKF